ncbi:hypothetical protein [Deinococcus taeanensis]|nr:hypothetical protein [Deinococcus taeanensis]
MSSGDSSSAAEVRPRLYNPSGQPPSELAPLQQVLLMVAYA